MPESFVKILKGYKNFVQKYAEGDSSIMEALSKEGQSPKTMVVACCDSRVDPALIFQCEPGDLFVVRNVANIVPPYEKDEAHHGTSAALEFGVKFLKVENLILLGHSQCGGIQALQDQDNPDAINNDFINNWVSVVHSKHIFIEEHDDYAKFALQQSYNNCLTFPWIKERLADKSLEIHLWFFDIKSGQILEYSEDKDSYEPVV